MTYPENWTPKMIYIHSEFNIHDKVRTENKDLFPCKYGHFDCAYKHGGTCFNEIESEYNSIFKK